MSRRRRRWLYAIGGITAAVVISMAIAVSVLARRFEPFLRDQAVAYLSDRFHCDVELASLKVHLPKLSPLNILLEHGKGVSARVEGTGISMRYRDAPDLPHLFTIQKFNFAVDLGTLFEDLKIVDHVDLDGMQINIPPRGERRPLGGTPAATEPQKPGSGVLIRQVRIHNGNLKILPKDRSKVPLDFDLQQVILRSAGTGRAMKYDASLTNPKPPGQIHSVGEFGPWVAEDPSDTPLKGDYTFDHADLSVFSSIAGILNSTGSFEGVLSSIKAKGEAKVPDFRLTMSGNPVPLTTRFEVLVDGTNGDTKLQPVQATLGSTQFQTSGAVIKHEGAQRRAIDLDVRMPNGNLRDVLRLAMKGSPFMEGHLFLKTRIAIPPLSGSVREKLKLQGQFEISGGKFLKSTIQDEIDKLSRRGQGSPQSQEIDEVVSNMKGTFSLENERINFRKLAFQVPGAAVDLSGRYDMRADNLDFLGSLKLQARVSETMTGWKRIVLKPVDPFFAKNGAGTFLRISVQGTSRQPKFGLAGKRKSAPETERARKAQK
jgi:hypothetical protein